MSHSRKGGESAEPNLTPILDMVFQLITFFMLVLNFKAAEVDLNLKLPVLGSAKPLPDDQRDMKFLVLNVEEVYKCPSCDRLATLRRTMGSNGQVSAAELVCEQGHTTKLECKNGRITDADRRKYLADPKTCLSVSNRLLIRQDRGKDLPSIKDYLEMESESSMLAAKPPLTRDDIVKKAKELDDNVVIRADANCRFGAVNYVITQCQALGYRKFALKTHDAQ